MTNCTINKISNSGCILHIETSNKETYDIPFSLAALSYDGETIVISYNSDVVVLSNEIDGFGTLKEAYEQLQLWQTDCAADVPGPNVDIEFVRTGCIENPDGSDIGYVYNKITTDEITGVPITVIEAHFSNGLIISPYTGTPNPCNDDDAYDLEFVKIGCAYAADESKTGNAIRKVWYNAGTRVVFSEVIEAHNFDGTVTSPYAGIIDTCDKSCGFTDRLVGEACYNGIEEEYIDVAAVLAGGFTGTYDYGCNQVTLNIEDNGVPLFPFNTGYSGGITNVLDRAVSLTFATAATFKVEFLALEQAGERVTLSSQPDIVDTAAGHTYSGGILTSTGAPATNVTTATYVDKFSCNWIHGFNQAARQNQTARIIVGCPIEKTALIYEDCDGFRIYRDKLTGDLVDASLITECAEPIDEPSIIGEVCYEDSGTELLSVAGNFNAAKNAHTWTTDVGELTLDLSGVTTFENTTGNFYQGLGGVGTFANITTSDKFEAVRVSLTHVNSVGEYWKLPTVPDDFTIYGGHEYTNDELRTVDLSVAGVSDFEYRKTDNILLEYVNVNNTGRFRIGSIEFDWRVKRNAFILDTTPRTFIDKVTGLPIDAALVVDYCHTDCCDIQEEEAEKSIIGEVCYNKRIEEAISFEGMPDNATTYEIQTDCGAPIVAKFDNFLATTVLADGFLDGLTFDGVFTFTLPQAGGLSVDVKHVNVPPAIAYEAIDNITPAPDMVINGGHIWDGTTLTPQVSGTASNAVTTFVWNNVTEVSLNYIWGGVSEGRVRVMPSKYECFVKHKALICDTIPRTFFDIVTNEEIPAVDVVTECDSCTGTSTETPVIEADSFKNEGGTLYITSDGRNIDFSDDIDNSVFYSQPSITRTHTIPAGTISEYDLILLGDGKAAVTYSTQTPVIIDSTTRNTGFADDFEGFNNNSNPTNIKIDILDNDAVILLHFKNSL